MNPQPDPEAQRYEREVMEGICHAMSEYERRLTMDQ